VPYKDLVAYGELWIDEAEQEVELARIIVRPAHRGRGVGKLYVKVLVDRAATFGYAEIFLRVLPDNPRAIHCYEAAGFAAVPSEDQKSFNRG